ncbi:MAG: LysR family transcriptional regulator [Croceibacterium sp.]
MPSLPFTLRQLDVFASLCATSSFRSSAESLGISQASVSSQMKALEDQLGASLFARRPGQRPVLTPEGMAFLDDLRGFQAAAETLAGHRRRAAEDQSARYRVLIGQGLLDNYVRAKLDRFFEAHPQIELRFEAHPPHRDLAREVEDGRFDFGLIHQRADRAVAPSLRELALVRGGIYGHRKFAEGQHLPLRAERINSLPFIMPLAASDQERAVLKEFDRWGIRPRRIVGHTQHYDVMGAMLERGLGVSSFADSLVPPDMRDEVILLHPLENWRLLWYRKDAGGDPRCDAVQAFLLSSVLQDSSYPTISVFAEPDAGG